jgi:predicted O-methyltransferase YrrM
VAVLRALARTGSGRWIRDLFGSDRQFCKYVDELHQSGFLIDCCGRLEQAFREVSGVTVRGTPFVHGAIKRFHAECIYALVRHLGPSSMVETGVCNGLSTSLILLAMERNGKGHLWSVDLPEFVDPALNATQHWEGKGGAAVPPGKSVGWLVPERLTDRWTLRLGASREILADLAGKTGPLDLFLHDSEHSYDNQSFEFHWALTHLRQGGLLLATDTGLSAAFDDLLGTSRDCIDNFWVDHSFAIARKRTT